MSRLSLLSVVLSSSLLFLLTISVCDGQYPGSLCIVNGTQGICRKVRTCPYVLYNEILYKRPPSFTCGYEADVPIVCCPTSELTTRLQTIVKPPIGYGRGAIAKAKCEEYTNATYTFQVPNLHPDRKFIIGGTIASVGEFPHMAAIGFNSEEGIKWNCGGTLISRQFVMTAAHCLFSINWGSASWVRLGESNLQRANNGTQPQDFQIVERIGHPNYKWPSLYHDIGLVKLEKELLFNAWIKPSCLPHSVPDTATIQSATATGWGLVNLDDETGSSNLLKVTVNLVPHARCIETFGPDNKLEYGVINEWQICAGQVGKDTCQGDSGGPLVIPKSGLNGLYTVIGITSVGRFCGGIFPGIYTRVYYYLPWIEQVVWPELL